MALAGTPGTFEEDRELRITVKIKIIIEKLARVLVGGQNKPPSF